MRTSTILIVGALMAGCIVKQEDKVMEEVQVTHDKYGHMLNGHQVFSPDGDWVVYDTRNDPTHIGRTCCIEKVKVMTGEQVRLYTTPDQDEYGPGVGAAAWHPREEKIIFIHGLFNCDSLRPYDFTRRFGALWSADKPSQVVAADARTVGSALVPGALRGGTHAHSWSGDGDWVSFTYNDYLLEQLEKSGAPDARDLRTIGVMAPAGKVRVKDEDAENFSGEFFSVLAASVTSSPTPGTDEIEKAFDECWIGRDGYVKENGQRQLRAIAFQGNVRTEAGTLITEVFVADLPEDVTIAGDLPLEGTATTRPSVPAGLVQRRVTFTDSRKWPGIQGPRHWLRSSPDGCQIYFLMKDDAGVVQVFGVSVNGGAIRQLTHLPSSVQTQFNVCPEGKRFAFVADNSVWISDIATGVSRRLTKRHRDEDAPVLAVLWSPDGSKLVYNRYVAAGPERYLQIFRIGLERP